MEGSVRVGYTSMAKTSRSTMVSKERHARLCVAKYPGNHACAVHFGSRRWNITPMHFMHLHTCHQCVLREDASLAGAQYVTPKSPPFQQQVHDLVEQGALRGWGMDGSVGDIAATTDGKLDLSSFKPYTGNKWGCCCHATAVATWYNDIMLFDKRPAGTDTTHDKYVNACRYACIRLCSCLLQLSWEHSCPGVVAVLGCSCRVVAVLRLRRVLMLADKKLLPSQMQSLCMSVFPATVCWVVHWRLKLARV